VAAAGISRALEAAGGAGGHGMRTLASTSRRSLDYFSSLDAHTLPAASAG
jgi:hypothetical protein